MIKNMLIDERDMSKYTRRKKYFYKTGKSSRRTHEESMRIVKFLAQFQSI